MDECKAQDRSYTPERFRNDLQGLRMTARQFAAQTAIGKRAAYAFSKGGPVHPTTPERIYAEVLAMKKRRAEELAAVGTTGDTNVPGGCATAKSR